MHYNLRAKATKLRPERIHSGPDRKRLGQKATTEEEESAIEIIRLAPTHLKDEAQPREDHGREMRGTELPAGINGQRKG